MEKFLFSAHRVEDNGLYIFAIRPYSLAYDAEIFVPREEAELFGWMDPVEEKEEKGFDPEDEDEDEDEVARIIGIIQAYKDHNEQKLRSLNFAISQNKLQDIPLQLLQRRLVALSARCRLLESILAEFKQKGKSDADYL